MHEIDTIVNIISNYYYGDLARFWLGYLLMVYEMLLHCADPDDEYFYDPDKRPETPSLLDKYLDFSHPWFEHHHRSQWAWSTEIDSQRILIYGRCQ